MNIHPTRIVKVGQVALGGHYPVAVQSMLNCSPYDLAAITAQMTQLDRAGCEIIRLAIPDMDAAKLLPAIKAQSPRPIVADIHFDPKLALAAIPAVDKIRINPGNIASLPRLREIMAKANDYGIPIRIGVNSGSLPASIQKRLGPGIEAMVQTALEYIQCFEDNDFFNLVISLKASSVLTTIAANRRLYQLMQERSIRAGIDAVYPLHLGITEAGAAMSGLMKSAVGIGVLLLEGIGSTIRISLTDEPVSEVRAAYVLLAALELRQRGVEIISCPTCGRTDFELVKKVSERLTEATRELVAPLKIAVMGCIVNGPGEAKGADMAIILGQNRAMLYAQGAKIAQGNIDEMFKALLALLPAPPDSSGGL
jgi:(E)-4-hydroxy-3-methylbut-2-enyl-diphosphate synthase